MNTAEMLSDALELLPEATLREAAGPAPGRRRRWPAAAAACLVLVIAAALAGRLRLDRPNMFTVQAYAYDPGDDAPSQDDVLENTRNWVGQYVDGALYISLWLRWEGQNVEDVTLETSSGRFARQVIPADLAAMDSEALADAQLQDRAFLVDVGAEEHDLRLVSYGTDFENLGQRFTVAPGELTDELRLFWAMDIPGMNTDNQDRLLPEGFSLTATARFKDGQTQQVPIEADLSEIPSYTGIPVGPEQQQEDEREFEYYVNLPLDRCELAEDSVRTVTEPCESGKGLWYDLPALEDFDENGLHVAGYALGGGYVDTPAAELYLTVYRLEDDGTITGMLYRVPHELWYDNAIGE